ncbi:hypothetical protein X777_12306 [Ooceraea biroi]|uniref:Uncharacterized protein n=1 Tax=Ooceraea biroi TaxID=2015173 RepID=A0A026W2F9_OOCBI|nr:hypothetical protein X777_12306 [Ooceraea biroi]
MSWTRNNHEPRQGRRERETDEDGGEKDSARDFTYARRRTKVKHAANHVTGIRCGVRQNCTDWASLDPTTGTRSRTRACRARRSWVVGVQSSFDFESSRRSGAWVAS